MRRLPYELYGASALMAAAIALILRAWTRERGTMKRMSHKVHDKVVHRAA